MPKQIFDQDKFLELSDKASECRVKRLPDKVKLKLRTDRYLYTLVTNTADAEAILEQVRCRVVEARPGAEEI